MNGLYFVVALTLIALVIEYFYHQYKNIPDKTPDEEESFSTLMTTDLLIWLVVIVAAIIYNFLERQ